MLAACRDVLDSPILSNIFDTLKSEELFLLGMFGLHTKCSFPSHAVSTKAVEVLGEIVSIRGLEKYPTSLTAIAHKVLSLRSDYQAALEGLRPSLPHTTTK